MAAYTLQPVNAPKASGFLLRALVWITEHLWGVSAAIARDAGFFAFRGRCFIESPVYYPVATHHLAGFQGIKRINIDNQAVKDVKRSKDTQDSQRLINDVKHIQDVPSKFTTASQLINLYKSGKETPVSVCESILAIIEEDLNADIPIQPLLYYSRQEIMRQAEASALRYKLNQNLPLDGVPIAVKDEVNLLPFPTSVGTDFITDIPNYNATVVTRMLNAGAIIIGKTRMHEFGLDTTGNNHKTGTPRNPYNFNHYTGGSSSGSAAIVACGICPISIGSDGGGSIRIPSAYTNLFGLKPTHGRVSGYGGYELSPSNGVYGPMASNSKDLALAVYFKISLVFDNGWKR